MSILQKQNKTLTLNRTKQNNKNKTKQSKKQKTKQKRNTWKSNLLYDGGADGGVEAKILIE